MSPVSRPRVRGLCLIATILALFVAAPAAHAAPAYGGPPTANGGTYLALGDSLAFGYQGYKVAACATPAAGFCSSPNTQFTTGYVNVFANLFAGAYPGVNVVNLGCPGETSGSLIDGSGPYPNTNTTGCNRYPFAIHSNHPGKTQLQAAVQVLRDQGKKVNPVTIDIGANDVLGLKNGCTSTTSGIIDLNCVASGAPATFATVQSNLDTTLNTLRAEGGKTKEILVVGIYNPLYVAAFYQVLGQTGNPTAAATAGAQTDALAANLNGLMASTATKYNAKFVNPLPTFNPTGGTPWQGPPPASQGTEINTLCALTLMCADLVPPAGADGDVHATDAGYAAIGNLLKSASGY